MRWKILVALFIIFLSTGLLTASLAVAQESTLNSGLALYFKFNNQSAYGENNSFVYDFSGNGNNGKVVSAKWAANGGKYGDGAFVFDGYNDKISIPDSPDLSISKTGELTIAMWVRFDRTIFTGEGSMHNYLHFMGKGGYGGDYEWMWRQHNASNSEGRPDRITFYVFNLKGGLGTGSYFEDKINLGEWIFVTSVLRGKNVEIWKNGIRRDVDPLSNYNVVPRDGPAPVNVGTADGDSYFKGSIDELRIYNRALSSSEILALYKLDPRQLPEDEPIVSSNIWTNKEFALKTGKFGVSFNATPLTENMDGIIGLSYGNASKYTDLAAIARFNIEGFIDARNGTEYNADIAVPYVAGKKYPFRMAVDLLNKKYDVFVRVNGVEKQIAKGYKFRSEQSETNRIDNYAIFSVIGNYAVSDMVIS